ncbi:MAG: lysostaphin resistance A-like protein [Thermoplasmatota archaeon]
MSYFKAPVGNGTQEDMQKDPNWNGVPPVGDRPIRDKWGFLGLVLIVFIVKIIIWGAYRMITGSVYPFTDPVYGSQITYWVGMVAKPILQLGPVFLLWRYLFREKGLPFRLTKVNLLSSVVWGLIGAVLFYIVASLVYVGHMEIMGYGTGFHIVAGWDGVGWGLTIAMLFSYMLGTGTAEELFSRGFLQDQTGRAFSISNAILFSAVLFAVGHLPISIFMHHMTVIEIFWYMLVLVFMGIFFSLLYQWSRNIVLVIIIHGLWDWYLTLFAVRGSIDPGFASDAGASFGRIDFINTIIAGTILLLFFYGVYRVFWKKQYYGKMSQREAALKNATIVRKIRERDTGKWPKHPVVFTFATVGIFCAAMFPIAGIIGTTDSDNYTDTLMIGEENIVTIIEEREDTEQGSVTEGGSQEIILDNGGNAVVSVNLTLLWEDESESDPRYTNRPDHFQISLMSPSGGQLGLNDGSNPMNGEGSIDIRWEAREGEESNETLSVIVDLLSAGDQEPLISPFNLRNIDDNSNMFRLHITMRVMVVTQGEEESGNIRW